MLLFLAFAYESVCMYVWGATLGDRLFGVYTISEDTDKQPNAWQAVALGVFSPINRLGVFLPLIPFIREYSLACCG